ncbi:MAG: flippase-like domain-containing protein [Deltaproteobacteria bacterium]|jgi:hypothetical protein|nr:flippase-like domain-containing protein [Deltaproteobacteria bacterium]
MEPERSKTSTVWKRARAIGPWVVGAALLAYVVSRLELDAFVEVVSGVNYPAYLAFVVVFNLTVLSLDSLATTMVYRRMIGPVRFGHVLLLRGASYAPSLVNHHLGQAWMTYSLARRSETAMRITTAATLIVYGTTLAALLVFGCLALVIEPGRFPWLLTSVLVVGGCGVVYMVIVRWPPRVIAQIRFLQPMLAIGIRGHVALLGSRLPHVGALFFGIWLAFRFFSVDIPFAEALALIPPLLVVLALPITPAGVGTRDALSLTLFAGFAAGGTVAEQQAAVAAATLSWAVAGSLTQIVLSVLSMRWLEQLDLRFRDPDQLESTPDEQV